MNAGKIFLVSIALVAIGTAVFLLGRASVPDVVTVAPTATLAAATETPTPEPHVAGVATDREIATVKRAVDGDTIELSDGRKLRYIGIDTPESVDPRKPVECIGPEATEKNKQLVEGKQVELEKDVSETDHFGRLLRYVYVDGVMVNDILVREGFARASQYPPDVKYQKQFDEAQASAQHNEWGIWSELCANPMPTVVGIVQPVVTPTASVSSTANNNSVAQTNTTPSGECVIKGNINSKNEYIYHLPECGSYEKTKIDPARGERYFCTEQEAQAAGWRKAGNC